MTALAKGSMTSWRYGNGMKGKVNRLFLLNPGMLGDSGQKWDSNKYLDSVEELSEMGLRTSRHA
ncbi:MAG: hypothetical protein CM15mP49_00120 [Actinomycetota bacterium]|nr:MAG: hypothetical protein CM15mP49_00120 [Actinomycetota bacterium]